MAIQISGTTVIDNSRNLTNIANATTEATANTYVIRDSSGRVCATNVLTGIAVCPLGSSTEGGRLIDRSSSIAWIVAPASSEVIRTWNCVNDAASRASQVVGCGGWFSPKLGQLSNPGYVCRTYWDSYASDNYWSSTCGINFAWFVNFANGNSTASYNRNTTSLRVRAFRCVTYCVL